MSETGSAPIRIGVSACLLGEKVRFDGGHKRDPFLVESFGRYVEWVQVCPEVELGLGTPRETLRLVRISNDVHLLMPKSGADHTDAMRAYAARRVGELAKENLSGHILKKDSPSCGMERVRVFDAHGVPAKSGRGLFVEALLQHFPHLPVEEEGDLFMSLIHTCELNDANPFDYLTELQKHAGELAKNPAAWMPWNYAQALQPAGTSQPST